MDEDESKLLCKIMMNYNDDNIREDLFAHFIRGLVEDAEKIAKLNRKNKGKIQINKYMIKIIKKLSIKKKKLKRK